MSFHSSNLLWSWLICRSRTCLYHCVEQLPDRQIAPDKMYLHAVPIACEFFSSLLPCMKLIILDINRTIPYLNSHLPDHWSRRLFTAGGMYNLKPMIGSDCGLFVCKRLCPSEVFHQTSLSWILLLQVGHRCFNWGGCIISVLTCLCS